MLHCQKRSAWTFELLWLEPITNFLGLCSGSGLIAIRVTYSAERRIGIASLSARVASRPPFQAISERLPTSVKRPA
jgi:hypothetical protein